ncbi:hypothetical protein, partial [Ralstonia solanacearum]|uniref:hypothetical protein n=1 Tax=Ralstonia solanacearum TaxID=305 RepID=UPI001E54C229
DLCNNASAMPSALFIGEPRFKSDQCLSPIPLNPNPHPGHEPHGGCTGVRSSAEGHRFGPTMTTTRNLPTPIRIPQQVSNQNGRKKSNHRLFIAYHKALIHQAPELFECQNDSRSKQLQFLLCSASAH